MRNVIVILLISTLLTGCSSAKKIHYLTPEEAMKYPVVMIANSDINCGKSKIVKGTIYIVKEVGGYKYKVYSNVPLVDTVLGFGKRLILPDDALLLILQEDDERGFIVYPNGQFVFDDYYYFAFNSVTGIFNTSTNQKCTFNAKSPFTLKNNR